MKKILIFMPFIGIFYVMLYNPKEVGLDNIIIFILSAFVQAMAISSLLIYLFNL